MSARTKVAAILAGLEGEVPCWANLPQEKLNIARNVATPHWRCHGRRGCSWLGHLAFIEPSLNKSSKTTARLLPPMASRAIRPSLLFLVVVLSKRWRNMRSPCRAALFSWRLLVVGFFGVPGGGWCFAAAVMALIDCVKRAPLESLGSTSAELTCAPSITTRVDVATDGTFALDFSLAPSVSTDGRYIAFSSLGATLAPGGASGKLDVYVRDRLTSQTTRASVSSAGAALNGPSSSAKLSGDGRFALFETNATNVVGTSTAGITHVYLRDLVAGTTERISTPSAGGGAIASSGAGSISADGRFV